MKNIIFVRKINIFKIGINKHRDRKLDNDNPLF